jgi:hypothetical protein
MKYAETGDFPRSFRGLHSNSTFQQLMLLTTILYTSIIFNPYPEQHDGKEEGSQTYETLNLIETDQ